jgi:hypothetical protein
VRGTLQCVAGAGNGFTELSAALEKLIFGTEENAIYYVLVRNIGGYERSSLACRLPTFPLLRQRLWQLVRLLLSGLQRLRHHHKRTQCSVVGYQHHRQFHLPLSRAVACFAVLVDC